MKRTICWPLSGALLKPPVLPVVADSGVKGGSCEPPFLDHLQKSWSDPKDSGGQGFKGSSEMLNIASDLFAQWVILY